MTDRWMSVIHHIEPAALEAKPSIRSSILQQSRSLLCFIFFNTRACFRGNKGKTHIHGDSAKMNDPVFCCSSITPQKPNRTIHDPKFSAFRNAAMNNDVKFLHRPLTQAQPSSLRKASVATSSKSSLKEKDRAPEWKGKTIAETDPDDDDEDDDWLQDCEYVIQVIKRFDLATIEWVRYFTNARSDAGGRRGGWVEVPGNKICHGAEGDGGSKMGWERKDCFKNFGCKTHYRLFELNMFEQAY